MADARTLTHGPLNAEATTTIATTTSTSTNSTTGAAESIANTARSLHAAAAANAALPMPTPAFSPPARLRSDAGQPKLGPASDAGLLADTRGGSDTTINDTRLNGLVSGNSATQVVTGANTIASGAFNNASGIPIVIQNSGANVLIQNATVINLKFN